MALPPTDPVLTGSADPAAPVVPTSSANPAESSGPLCSAETAVSAGSTGSTGSVNLAETYQDRLDRAMRLVTANNFAGLVFSSGVELLYLLGTPLFSHERLTALVITAEGTTLVAPAVERGDVGASFAGASGMPIRYWEDGENPHTIVSQLLPEGTVGVGSTMTADHLIPLMESGHTWVLAAPSVRELFMRKDGFEVEQLRLAGAAIDRVHAEVPGLLRAGRTEREVAADIDKLICREHVCSDFIIVGSGPNGANPHHEFSDRVINDGDVVVVDIGGTLPTGYHSDCTRTYVVGKVTEQQQRIYDVLYQAQKAAVQAVKPGVTAAEIDAVARDAISDAGYGDQFIHRTGHGIGLSTHEEPFIMPGNALVLEPGMAFSIEPGIYFAGEWGARIEDIVIVTDDGCESVNNQPHSLVAATGGGSE